MPMADIKRDSYSMTSSGMSFMHISTDISNILEIFRIQKGGGGVGVGRPIHAYG